MSTVTEQLINKRRVPKEDMINHPSYYAKSCSMECIDAMEITFGIEAVIHYCKCNAFKYLWRYKNKNGLEDLEKALWYCNKGLEKASELYQLDSEYIDKQIDTMVKKIYMYMEQQNVNKQEIINNMVGEEENENLHELG